MTATTKLRIQPFLEHYSAYVAWREYEAQFDNLAKLLHPDNNCYLFDTPWQKLVEDRLKQAEPDIWDWYTWWLFETAEGNGSYEFQLEDWAGATKTYNVAQLSLTEFLEIIAHHYE